MKKITIILMFLIFGSESLANDLKLEPLCNLITDDTKSTDCYNSEYKYWNKKLNEYYQALTNTLDQEAQMQLEKTQRAWINEIKEACLAKADSVVVAQCLALTTKQQSRKIRQQIKLFDGYWPGDIHGNSLELEAYKFYLQDGKNICGITRRTQYYIDEESVTSTGKTKLYYDHYEQITPNLAKKKEFCTDKDCFNTNNIGQQNLKAQYLMICEENRPADGNAVIMFEIDEEDVNLGCKNLLDAFVDTRVAKLSQFIYSDETPKEQQFLQDNEWITDCLNSED